MRRVGNLWDELTSFENLYTAFVKARRGKRGQAAVERFNYALEPELPRLQAELRAHAYRPGPHLAFCIRDPKPRLISAAPFRDRVAHHAFCNVVEPVFERCFIHDSYACRPGKGTHAAVNRYTEFARRHAWVLKCDVRKFFPSVDHQVLKELLARKIKDQNALWLAGVFIDHANEQEPVEGFFPGDDLFTASERRRGLPIGNQTSQFFANVYLNPLDHFVKEQSRCGAYVRYVDDFLLLSDDPGQLHAWREAIRRYLQGLRLWLRPTKQVISRAADGTRFLGYRAWPTHRLLPKENVRRLRRRMRVLGRRFAQGRAGAAEIRQRVCSWLGHARQADTWRLRTALFGDMVFVGWAAQRRAFCVGAPGTTTPGTRVPPTGTTTRPTTGTTT